MDITGFLTERQAASSVVGIVLMVAVTIVLASLIGVFVFGIGEPLRDIPPQAKFVFDFDDDANVTISHEGGMTIPVEDTMETEVSSGNLTGDDWEDLNRPINSTASVTLTHVDDAGSDAPWNGEQVYVIWESENGDVSAVLARATAPKN